MLISCGAMLRSMLPTSACAARSRLTTFVAVDVDLDLARACTRQLSAHWLLVRFCALA